MHGEGAVTTKKTRGEEEEKVIRAQLKSTALGVLKLVTPPFCIHTRMHTLQNIYLYLLGLHGLFFLVSLSLDGDVPRTHRTGFGGMAGSYIGRRS